MLRKAMLSSVGGGYTLKLRRVAPDNTSSSFYLLLCLCVIEHRSCHQLGHQLIVLKQLVSICVCQCVCVRLSDGCKHHHQLQLFVHWASSPIMSSSSATRRFKSSKCWCRLVFSVLSTAMAPCVFWFSAFWVWWLRFMSSSALKFKTVKVWVRRLVLDSHTSSQGLLSGHLLQNVICELLTNVSCLASQILFKVVFLRSESLDLTLVEHELLSESLTGLLESIDLTLERGVVGVGVICRRVHCHFCWETNKERQNALVTINFDLQPFTSHTHSHQL